MKLISGIDGELHVGLTASVGRIPLVRHVSARAAVTRETDTPVVVVAERPFTLVIFRIREC